MSILKNLFWFGGRLSRKAYWLIALPLIVGNIALAVVLQQMIDSQGSVPEYLIISRLVLFVLSLWILSAIGVKRFHDRGRSGWNMLLAIVMPVVGWVMFLVVVLMRSKAGPNIYGPDPLAPITASEVS